MNRPVLFQLAGILSVLLLVSGMVGSQSPIADAAMRGDNEAVRSLLGGGGVDVNAAQGDGMTALHWAGHRGDVELAEMLIRAGADLHAGTRIGSYTPLHVASRVGKGAVVRLLAEAGADVSARSTTSGATPLHLAAAAGDAEAVRALLDHGAEMDATEAQWGQTPLMFAATRNRVEALRILLERGADPGITALSLDVTRLAEVDAEAQARFTEVLAEFRGKEERPGWQPSPTQLQEALRASREVLQSADVLKEGGEAAPDDVADEEEAIITDESAIVGGWGGLTALLHTVREGHQESALALLDGGADINQGSVGDGTTPLLMAAVNGHFDLVLTLLERGADPNLTSDAGAGPLWAAINTQWAPRSDDPQPRAQDQQEATHVEVMRALLEAGADPNARLTRNLWYSTGRIIRFEGATPFWRAAYGTDVEVMRLLVAYGADPHVPTRHVPGRRLEWDGDAPEDPSGVPPVPVGGPAVWPIHAASGVGYGEGFAANQHRHVPEGWLPAVRYLVEELGADVNVRDPNAYTALHHAAARGDNELVLYLVEKGADVTVVSREGQTTADMANGPYQRIRPFPSTIALLERLGSKNNNRCVGC